MNKSKTDIQSPEFIHLYHAIDWIAGLFDEPIPIFAHEELYSELSSKHTPKAIAVKRKAALAKLKTKIFANRVAIYGKPFQSVFYVPMDNAASENLENLDSPTYAINRENQSIELLPNQNADWFHYVEFLEKFHSPIDFDFVQKCIDANKIVEWVPFSFSHLDEESIDLYGIDKFGLTYDHAIDRSEIDESVVLLFVRTREIQKLFFQEYETSNVTGAGRPKKYYVEISMLRYLQKMKKEFAPSEGEILDNFLREIRFEDKFSKYLKADASERHSIVSGISNADNVLSALVSETQTAGLNLVSLFDLPQDYFVNTLVEDGIGSTRTLQDHFNIIKSCVLELN